MKFLRLSFVVALVLSSTGCMPGGFQFDYYWNPVNVTAKALEALETGDTSDWMDLFTSQALCVYGNEKGYLALRKTLGPNTDRYRSDYTVSDSRLVQSSGTGTSTREIYELTVARSIGSSKVFTIQMVCHQSPSNHFCTVYNLIDHVNGSPDHSGTCDSLLGAIE